MLCELLHKFLALQPFFHNPQSELGTKLGCCELFHMGEQSPELFLQQEQCAKNSRTAIVILIRFHVV